MQSKIVWMRCQALAVALIALATMAAHCFTMDQNCVPGQTQECLCPGSGSGAQICDGEGQRWSDCDCTGFVNDGGNGGGSDVGHDSDIALHDLAGGADTGSTVDCPNGTCGAGEDCNSCPADCGACSAATFSCDSNGCSFTECDDTVHGPPLYFTDDIVTYGSCATQIPQWFTDRECFGTQWTVDVLSTTPATEPCWLVQWACPQVDGAIQWLHWNMGEGDEFTPGMPEPTYNAMPQVCCTPDCAGKQCGDNGCGGSCGTCTGSEMCRNNICECPSSCQEGRVCCGGAFCGGDCVGSPCC